MILYEYEEASMENPALSDEHQTRSYSKWGILSFLTALVMILAGIALTMGSA